MKLKLLCLYFSHISVYFNYASNKLKIELNIYKLKKEVLYTLYKSQFLYNLLLIYIP